MWKISILTNNIYCLTIWVSSISTVGPQVSIAGKDRFYIPVNNLLVVCVV